MLHLSSNINDSSHWNIDIQLNILTQSIKSLKEHGKHSDIFTDTKYKYKYKYFIGRNTITIIGKGSKWSYSSCLWIENMKVISCLNVKNIPITGEVVNVIFLVYYKKIIYLRIKGSNFVWILIH
jgi:hypothetical protein